MATNISATTAHNNTVVNDSVTAPYNLRFVTLNMHGFNQSSVFLKEICDDQLYNVIYIQEHWLTPASMYKIKNISSNYTCHGISAME